MTIHSYTLGPNESQKLETNLNIDSTVIPITNKGIKLARSNIAVAFYT